MASNLAQQLLVKPGARVLLLNAPIGYAKKLQPLPEGATVSDKRDRVAPDVSIVFVRDTAELKRLQSGFATLEEDAVLWVCYPEGAAASGTDLDRDTLRSALENDELVAVSRVAFDEKWSCVQFKTDDAEES